MGLQALLKRTSDDLLPDGTHEHPTHVPKIQREAYLWIGVIDIFIFTISTVLFVYRGRRTLDINAHAVLLTTIGSVTVMFVNTCFLFQFVWPGKFPCFVILWAAYPGVMLWMSCTLARALRLYILSYRNTEKLKERNRVGQLTAAQLYGKGVVDEDEGVVGEREENTWMQRKLGSMRRWWAHEKMQITERRLVWYVLFVTLFSAIICSIIQALTKDLAIVPMMFSKCPVGVWEYFPLYALIAFYCVVLTPIIVYHVWPIKDAFGIRHDILLNNMFTFVCIVMFMVQTNQGFGGRDPFWDSFLWCALLFNLSQFTSVIHPLIKSYRQSDMFSWSDNSGRTASKELFYRVLNDPDLFDKLKVYSASNFCTEITLFLEEYQVLKANAVRFYNMGEPSFDIDSVDEPADIHDSNELNEREGVSSSDSNAHDALTMSPRSQIADTPDAQNEKDAMRFHLNREIGAGQDLESNPDTIISVYESEYGDQAAMVNRITSSDPPVDPPGPVASSTRVGGLLRTALRKCGKRDTDRCATEVVEKFNEQNNVATLAGGGATMGRLPMRRNSQGEDIMVLSRVPPYTPVRYTVLTTLMQTPAGLGRQSNMSTFKTLPFALRGDYYGFYSTFIADGATLQINVEGRISEVITRLIHSQQYTVDMMDEAHSEVLQLLYDNIFKKFVRVHYRDLVDLM